MIDYRKRNAYIEMCRFIGAIMIMLLHTNYLGGVSQQAPGAWIFVEYFFILSGFFMTKHFALTTDSTGKDAFVYVVKKRYKT